MKRSTVVRVMTGCAILSILIVSEAAAQGRGGGGRCQSGSTTSTGQSAMFRGPSSTGLAAIPNSFGIGPNYASQQAYAQMAALQWAQQQAFAQQAQRAWLERQAAIAQAEAREKQLKQEKRALAIQKRKEKEAAKEAHKKANPKAVIQPVAQGEKP